MYALLVENVVTEVFSKKPIFNETLMASVIEQKEVSVGDHFYKNKNVGKQPSSFHHLQGGEWIHDVEAQKTFDSAAKKLIGFDYEGVMCSATAEDQHGLTDILVGMQSGLIKETPFIFENGSVLVLNPETIQPFAAAWGKFRQSFFTV